MKGPHPPGSGELLLEAEHISVQLGDRVTLDDVSLGVEAGRVLAILGPNGAGKTTLLKALLGLVPRTRGQIRIGNRELSRLSMDERARALGYVPQHTALEAPLTVREVVAMGRFAHQNAALGSNAQHRRAIAAAMAEVDMEPLADRYFSTLSGGEQARVLIARALAGQSPLILLDEPTARLDVSYALDCLRCMRQLADGGKGVLVVMHDLNQVSEWTDQAILLDRGRAVCSGPSREVLANHHIASVYGVELVRGGGFGFRRCTPQAEVVGA